MHKGIKAKFMLTASLTLVAQAAAAPQLNARSIIINPVATPLTVKVWSDRQGRSGGPQYAVGEAIRLSVQVSRDAYIYLFNVDPNGKVDMIVPNRYVGEHLLLKAAAPATFPAVNASYSFDIAAPYGENKVLAVASVKPLDMAEIAAFKSTQDKFAVTLPAIQGQGQLAQALSIVVTPVPQTSWNSAATFYTVR